MGDVVSLFVIMININIELLYDWFLDGKSHAYLRAP